MTETIIRRGIDPPNPWEIVHQGHTLLFDEHPLVVRPTLAKLIGLNEAIILQQIHYWITRNAQDEHNMRDGHYWTYNSVPGWQRQFPFWSQDTIRRILNRLTGKGKGPKPPKLLITGNYNNLKIDRTLWYRIDYDRLGIIAKNQQIPIMAKCIDGNGKMHRPLPETTSIPETTITASFPDYPMIHRGDIRKTYGTYKREI